MHILQRNLAGKSRVEFFIEHYPHFLEKVNLFGYGKSSPQKLQFFYFLTIKVFSNVSSHYPPSIWLKLILDE